MLLASDRRQARVLKQYVSGLLRSVPMLEQMIANETSEGIELDNGIVIEVHTASFRSVRGYTIVAAIPDEIAFWDTDDSANPDTEILNALRPAMATVPGALLLLISSPYARRGELWKAYKDHFGKDGDPVLVSQADTRTMNPLVPQIVIDNAYQADEASASAEYGAQFRRDVEVFVSREVVEACITPGCFELPPLPNVAYSGFADPSGGSQDSMTLAIAHWGQDRAVLDCVREARPPFSPDTVVEEFAATLKTYGLHSVTGDRYGGLWPQERFQKHGIEYIVSDLTRSDLYRELLPLLNSRSVTLLDHQRLVTQLCSLERRTARGGKDSIDHGPHSHDDVINSAAGALVLVVRRAARVPFGLVDTTGMTADEVQAEADREFEERKRAGAAWLAEKLAVDRCYFPGD